MNSDYGSILKRRALGFLNSAKDSFSRGDFDLVLFHVEQFLQLYIKYLLYIKTGAYPKTHSLIYLLEELTRILGNDTLKRFINENLEALYLLEDAYITSRYLPREYGRDIAERILKFAERALEVLKWVEEQR